ncbi:MAG: hypothetical protein CMQ19_14105 [Gammaproteobacteria bacterium]|nr:hypothetical protein [Gammaproteobacteria bacterium]
MGSLDHLRVVEYGSSVMAPFCARLFADMGAEVIKVEPPGGEQGRHRGPFAVNTGGEQVSGFFQYLNAGKSSLTADLNDSEDRAQFARLLASADVFIENLPNALRLKWGLDSDLLADECPHLVVVSLSPYGRSGPWKDKEGSDICVQAASALSARLGIAGSLPLKMPFDQADYQASLNGVAAALCALIEREKSGLGQGIDISSTQVLAYQCGAMALVSKKMGGKWVRAGKTNKAGIYPSGFYECADGHLVIASPHGRLWLQFLKLMGDPEWSNGENQRDAMYLARCETEEPAHIHFKEWLMQNTRAQMLEMTMETDIIMGVVNHVDEVYASEQFAYRDFWSEVTLGDKGAKFPKMGALMSETPCSIRADAPQPGPDIKSISASHWKPRKMTVSGGERGDALAGIRVLDFGWNWAGPMAGQLLADMGAEVIRVETNKRLDNMRLEPYSYYFCHNNRNKLSTTFNLKDADGVRLVKELVKESDVVMENFAAGVMAKNGLDFAELEKLNPGIVLMSMSMAGEEGPLNYMKGFASIATAYSGIEGITGYPETNDVVGFTSFGLGDTNMAMQGTIGTLAALIHKSRSGKGQFVDVSQIESSTATLGEMIMEHAITDSDIGIQGNYHPEYAPHNFFATRADDTWVAVSVTNDQEWQGLCRAIDRQDLFGREDLKDPQSRRLKVDELDAILRQWCQDREREDVLTALESEGVCIAPLLSMEDRDRHPVFTERGHVHHHESPNWDDCDIYNTPWLMSATPPKITGDTPTVGQQNEYVFRDILKLSDSEIDRLVTNESLY